MKDLSIIERAAVAEELASVIRHDLRNRLAGVGNAATYLKNRTRKADLWRDDPRMEKFFSIIEEELAAAAKLIGERLAMGHLFGRDAQPLRLGEHVRAVVAAPEGVTVALALDDQGEVVAAPGEVELLVRHLVGNAIEAMAGHGSLTVRTFDHEGYVVLDVQDSGPGFTDESRKQAMLPFRSDKPGHTGIGLNIVARIAARYGGALAIGTPPSGALVSVTLPQHRPTPA